MDLADVLRLRTTMSKKNRRLESKKRKIQAFLKLAKESSDSELKTKRLKLSEQASCSDSDTPDDVADDKPTKQDRSVPKSTDNQPNAVTNGTDNQTNNDTDRQTDFGRDSRVELSKPVLSPGDLAKLREDLKKRQKASLEFPKIYLDLDMINRVATGKETAFRSSNELYVIDVQHLLLQALQGSRTSFMPRWCKLLRYNRVSHVLVVIVDGVSSTDFTQHQQSFPFLAQNFPLNVDVVSPSQYAQSVVSELFRVQYSARQLRRKLVGQDGTSELSGFRIGTDVRPRVKEGRRNERVSRVELLLSPEQMVLEGYPMPNIKADKMFNYIYTKKTYTPVTDDSPMYSIDCEMCCTTTGKEVTRIAIVDENLHCIYDTFVKPRSPITDYLTRYSGVTPALLENVNVRLEDVQRRIQEILPSDAIIMAQSLNFDLHALRMMHPYVIDTSVIYNTTASAGRKTSLKKLTQIFLSREIQTAGSAGHDPREDALATMELTLLKLQQGAEFGNILIGGTLDTVKLEQRNNESSSLNASQNSVNSVSSNGDVAVVSSDTPGDLQADTIQRRHTFYNQPNFNSFQSFFNLAKQSEKSVVMVGFGNELPAGAESVVQVSARTDEQAVRRTKRKLKRHFMVCTRLGEVMREAQLHTCTGANHCSRCLQMLLVKLDCQLKELVESTPEKTLNVILFAGKTDDEQTHDAKCFVNITTAPLKNPDQQVL